MARYLLAPLAVVAALAAGLWVLGGVLAPGKWWAIGLSVAWFFAVSALAGRVVKRDARLRVPVRGTFVLCAVLASAGFYWTSVRETRVDEAVEVPRATVAPAERAAALRGDSRSAAEATPTPTPARQGRRAPARERAKRARRTTARAPRTPSPTPTATATPRPKPKAATTPRATRTPAADADADVSLVRGAFRGADDHATSGTATVVRLAEGRRFLTFTGFESDGGVDVRVYLVAGDGSGVSDHVELGRLKGNAGNQRYAIPADVDLSRYGTVVLWCVPFTVRVGVAPLS